MQLIKRNDFWFILFSFCLLYWFFNITALGSLIIIIPLLLALISKN